MKKNKVAILFLVRFFLVYFAFTLMYSFYLRENQLMVGGYSCAPITKTVASHSKYIVEALGYTVQTSQSTEELSMKFLVNNKYVARIVEGCSSISIIILFWAFIVAFSGKVKTTLLFGIFGTVMIYLVNIFRIVFLTLAIYHYPQYNNILHAIVFPAIIYGMVFVLWIVWVKKFAISIKTK